MRRGLVLQGGGLIGAFAAGADLALAELGLTDFEVAVAVSASVPTLAYFLAGQYREGREVWEHYLATKRFVRYSSLLFRERGDYRHRPLLDTHYLVFQVFRDRFPLNLARFTASNTEAYFVATDAETYTYGRWLPMGNKGAVDRLDDPSGSKRGWSAKGASWKGAIFRGEPWRIRTSDSLLKRQELYLAELTAHGQVYRTVTAHATRFAEFPC